jgi:membrane carboxypeptidase/penicillin-binding protein PbpC
MNELAEAYGVFATEGIKNDQVAILKVTDSTGTVLFEHKPVEGRRVMSEEVAYLISDMLSDNEARKAVFGPSSLLVISGKTVAVKTGTTDDKRDNWTAGYTPSRVVVAWVGNNDNSPMNPALASGVTGAAPIWNRIMKASIKDIPVETFKRPDSVIEMDIDALGGGTPVDGQPTRKERFVKGTEPTQPAAIYQEIKVSRSDSKKFANQLEIIGGDYDTRKAIVIKEDDPISTDGKNRWQEGIDTWMASQPDDKYHVPTETYDGGEDIRVRIKEPSGGSRINSNTFKFIAEAASRGSITKMMVYANDKQIMDKQTSRIDEEIHLDNGSYRLKVRAEDDRGRASDSEIKIGISITSSVLFSPNVSK